VRRGISLIAAALAACAAPAREKIPVVDVRLCVSTEEEAALYRPLFESAAAVEPRGGRDCDAVVKAATLHAGMIKVTSAYDGSTLADIEGTLELAPSLVKLALGQETEGYQRVRAQRKEAGR